MYEASKKAEIFYLYANYGTINTKYILKVNNSPKLSIVIPVFSTEKTIKRAIISAQNQNFSDFEIILIDDFSKDKTLKIIEEMGNIDKRIKIIKNKNNMGTLYSRCIGTLKAKGKYILPLDSDDMFLYNDTFYSLSQEIDKEYVDIIKYRGIETFNSNNPLNHSRMKIIPKDISDNKILYQPELGIFGEKRCCLWMQCINAEFYKKGINLYGEQRIRKKVTFLEDCIIHFILYQKAKSLKLYLKIGLLHIQTPGSVTKRTKRSLLNKYYIYLYEVFLEFAHYVTWTKDWIVKRIIKLFKRYDFKKTIKDKNTKDYIKVFIKKILFNEHISNRIKKVLVRASFNCNLIKKQELNEYF